MSISMNLHDVASIELGEINSADRNDGTTFYWRGINFKDAKGNNLMTVDALSDNGHHLLVSDPILDDMKLPFELKAA